MTKYDQRSGYQYNREGKQYHQPENDHTDSDGPDGLETDETIMYIEAECKIDNNDLYDQQPNSSFDQKQAQFFFAFTTALKKSSRACKKNKNGCAEMRDPPGEIKNGCCRSQVKRVIGPGWLVKKITGMVKRHDDHDQTAKQVDRIDAVGFVLL